MVHTRPTQPLGVADEARRVLADHEASPYRAALECRDAHVVGIRKGLGDGERPSWT
jgi:hypothetical protein